jgi:hypothetical protein
MHQKNKNIWFTVIILLTVGGCGYHFTGSGVFPKGADRIFVEILENKTSESGVENIVTRNLISEFTLREDEALVGNINDADSILSGAVSRVAFYTIVARGKDSAAQRRVTVWVDLKLADRDGREIWAAKGLSDNEAYSVVDDKNVTERNKRVAIAIASRRIAERALNRLTDDF